MPTTITTAKRLAIEGPIGMPTAIVCGLIIVVLFAWLLKRESYVLGLWNSVFFWILRTIAVGVVIWMLLAPTSVVVETTTTRKAIVIATDVSGSMLTVDPAGASDDQRWSIAQTLPANADRLKSVDQAAAALGFAQRQLKAAELSLQHHSEQRHVIDSMTAADAALKHVRKQLQTAIQNSTSTSDHTGRLITRLIALLDGSELQSFSRLCQAFQRNRTPAEQGWQEGLPDLSHRVSAIQSAMQEVAQSTEVEERHRVVGNGLKRDSESRVNRVVTAVEAWRSTTLNSLQDRVDVRYASFDQSLHWLTGPPARVSNKPGATKSDSHTSDAVLATDLSATLETLQRESAQQPFAAVFLFSDVAHNQTSDKNPRDVAATLTGTPVYVVPIGNTQYVRDIQLYSVFSPAVAMRNDDIVIEASLRAYDCEGEVCTIQLQENGEVVDQREILIDSGMANRNIRFERRVSKLGLERFRVVCRPVDGELTADNNERDLEVNVTRNEIKILIADEYPRWEYRYLTQLFRRDTKVECDELLFHPRMIATGRRETSRSLPTTVDEWDQYDAVILGDIPAEHFPSVAQEGLAKYLHERGGCAIIISGPDSMPQAFKDSPLGEILPVGPSEAANAADPAGYEFRLTSAGREHPALMIGETEDENRVAWDLVNQYTPLTSVSSWRQPRAAAKTLLAAVRRRSDLSDEEAARNAFLCWQPVGRGRVVYLSSPETFRLRFLRGDRLYYRFWGQLLRWTIASDLAAGTKFVRVRTDKSRYTSREAIQVIVRLTDANGDPVVTDHIDAEITGTAGSRTTTLKPDPRAPGEYHAEVRAMPAGDYRIEPVGELVEQLQKENSAEAATANLTVYNVVSNEMTETRCDRALAQQIADTTQGLVLPPTAIDEILELTNLDPIVSESIQQRPLWVRWEYLWIVFGCLQSEWTIRRRLGVS